jgi:hypothetical protein
MIKKISNSKFGINLGFLSIETNWELDESQSKASWEMYVELATRISTAGLEKDDVILREALSSLYSLFGITREILKKYGPTVATPKNPKDTTFGHLSIGVLNKVLRPFLARWHPLLLDWEQKKPKNKSIIEHESKWKFKSQFRSELNDVRLRLTQYANVLGTVSGVAKLI